MRSGHLARTWLILLVAFGLAMMLMSGCARRAPVPAQAVSSVSGSPASLRETYDLLRQWRTSRAYLSMKPHLDADCRDDWIDLLVAVDELLAANAGALQAARDASPGVEAERFDMSWIADRIELFSRDVKFIRQEEQGDAGTVTVQVADQVPLKEMKFERRGGRWVYLPGPAGREIVGIVREIANALGRVAAALATGPKSAKEVEKAYRVRIEPPLEKMRTLTAAALASAEPRSGAADP